MVFNFFRKKKQGTPKPDFSYFPSEKEKSGLTAIPLKQQLEDELEKLDAKSKKGLLTPEDHKRQHELKLQLEKLLSSGQVKQNLHAKLAVAQSGNDTRYSDWIETSSNAEILLVDDDKDLTALLQFCVGRIASKIHVINDGEDLMTWIQKNPPASLISLDLMLPRKDGLQIITYIRQNPEWKKVPILVLSSKSDEGTVQKALEAGADDYMTKPIQPDAYLARLQKLLKR